jgi:hypothetical protein
MIRRQRDGSGEAPLRSRNIRHSPKLLISTDVAGILGEVMSRLLGYASMRDEGDEIVAQGSE